MVDINPKRSFPAGGGVKMPEDPPAHSPLPYGLFDAGLKVYTIYLDNARTEHEVKISGNVFWAYRASATSAKAFIRFNNLQGDKVEVTQGLFIAGHKYSSIFITNTAQSGAYIHILYTTDASQQIRVFNADQSAGEVNIITPDGYESIADVTLAAGATNQIVAGDADRVELILTNLDGAETLRIGDTNAAAARGTPLPPGGNIILTTTAAVYGYNPGAGGVDVAITQTTQS